MQSVFHLGWCFKRPIWVSGKEKELCEIWDTFFLPSQSLTKTSVLFFEVLQILSQIIPQTHVQRQIPKDILKPNVNEF